MITGLADILARLRECDSPGIDSPDHLLMKSGLLRSILPVEANNEGGIRRQYLLDSHATHTVLRVEDVFGPYLSDIRGYPLNGAEYGQRVWVVSGAAIFIAPGEGSGGCREVSADQNVSFRGGIWNRIFVPKRLLALVEEPHGSLEWGR